MSDPSAFDSGRSDPTPEPTPVPISKPTPDPTLVRNQPALTRGPGNSWLVIGTLMTLISGLIFAFALNLHPPGVALVGLLAVLALYILMVLARLTIVPGRVRLGTLAVLLLALSLVALVGLGIIAWTEWSAL